MNAHVGPLECLETRDTPAPITPGPATQPQAAEFADSGPQETTPSQTSTPGGADNAGQQTTMELDDSGGANSSAEQARTDSNNNASASLAFPVGGGSLSESGIASTRFATDGFGAASSPLALYGATGATAESGSAALTQSTGFGPSLAPTVDRLTATARPRDELSGLGFRGRLVFPNSNSPERSATTPGPMQQQGVFLLSGGNGGQAAQEESTPAPAGARVALAEPIGAGEAEPEAEEAGGEE